MMRAEKLRVDLLEELGERAGGQAWRQCGRHLLAKQRQESVQHNSRLRPVYPRRRPPLRGLSPQLRCSTRLR